VGHGELADGGGGAAGVVTVAEGAAGTAGAAARGFGAGFFGATRLRRVVGGGGGAASSSTVAGFGRSVGGPLPVMTFNSSVAVWKPFSANVAVWPSVTCKASEQGVRHVWSPTLTSAPGGSDSKRTASVTGAGLKKSKFEFEDVQAASRRPPPTIAITRYMMNPVHQVDNHLPGPTIRRAPDRRNRGRAVNLTA